MRVPGLTRPSDHGKHAQLLQSLLVRSGTLGKAHGKEGMRFAVRETGQGMRLGGRQKKVINPINSNLEALPACLKWGVGTSIILGAPGSNPA